MDDGVWSFSLVLVLADDWLLEDLKENLLSKSAIDSVETKEKRLQLHF